MVDRPDKPISADRRGFFRQIFVSAIESVEKVGREMADKFEVEDTSDPYEHSNFDWNWSQDEEMGFGPPWPPPFGPPIPVAVRAELRQIHSPTVEWGQEPDGDSGDSAYGDED
jgi:hypothetical protein